MEIISNYIANQIGDDYLDELQKMTLCFILKHNVALDGVPGIGKTESVLTLAKILGKEVYDKGCSEDTTENQIIGFPVLEEKNGATVTRYVDGPLSAAMRTGNIFYGDEFNLLRKDKQKSLNAAFDSRRFIIKADNEKVKANQGFFSVISYNPSNTLTKRDLEESVADRFIHIHYKPLKKELESYLSLLKVAKDLKIGTKNIETRAVVYFKDKVKFFLKYEDSWVDFFTGVKIKPELIKKAKPYFRIYQAYIPPKLKPLFRQTDKNDRDSAFRLKSISEKLSNFFECVRNMIDKGSVGLDPKVAKTFPDFQMFTHLPVHRPSLRISSSALQHYNLATKMGMLPASAKNYIAHLCMDHVCYGQFRGKKIGELTCYNIVKTLTELYGLLPDHVKYSYDFVKKKTC